MYVIFTSIRKLIIKLKLQTLRISSNSVTIMDKNGFFKILFFGHI
jgi:hypothetical protein